MNQVEQAGHDAIAQAVESVGGRAIVIEQHRNFGDVLHSTVVVRQFRLACPDQHVVWAIDEKYADTFSTFNEAQLGPHAIARLPALPPFPDDGPYRIRWVHQAKQLPGVDQAFGCGVHPWGWRGGSIVDGILANAGIVNLIVPRRPWLPLLPEDIDAAQRFIVGHGLEGGFVAIEYNSYSLKLPDPSWYSQVVRLLNMPAVALAGPKDPELSGARDGRTLSFRQAKALLRVASCFLGSGSGLGVLAASNGCEQPVVELVNPKLGMPALGYRPNDHRYASGHGMPPARVAALVGALTS